LRALGTGSKKDLLDGIPEDGSATSVGSGREEVRFQVSSRHLSLTSPVFGAMFRLDFKEGTALRSTGRVEVALEDDNPAAFLIFLNIIHGYTRRVPRKISLEMLSDMAFLVDKYECLEAVEVFSDMWIDGIKSGIPHSLMENLLRWLCIAWVFRRPTEFKRTTEIIEHESTGNVLMDLGYGLPIPSSVFGQFSCRYGEPLNIET
jgi:hypothetical protein